jgi:zinc transport system ATP-binding protein
MNREAAVRPILTCRDLSVGYGEAVLCSGISLTIREGEYVSLVGPRGSGKSALIATMLGALEPMAGEVIFENGLRREQIGCMPQDSEIRGTATVRDTVLAGCLGQMRHLFVGRAERRMAMEQLERLGVADLEKRRIGELSGGQRQRVFLARALCGKKRLLLLDEPLKGLDVAARDELFSEIARIREEDGCAVVMVDSEAIDGTVLHISDTVRFCGPVEEYARSLPGQLTFSGHIL